MSLTDTYEVEETGGFPIQLRCRRCGRIWNAFDGKSWRCPNEFDHDPIRPRIDEAAAAPRLSLSAVWVAAPESAKEDDGSCSPGPEGGGRFGWRRQAGRDSMQLVDH
jgi:hypothetical protein